MWLLMLKWSRNVWYHIHVCMYSEKDSLRYIRTKAYMSCKLLEVCSGNRSVVMYSSGIMLKTSVLVPEQYWWCVPVSVSMETFYWYMNSTCTERCPGNTIGLPLTTVMLCIIHAEWCLTNKTVCQLHVKPDLPGGIFMYVVFFFLKFKDSNPCMIIISQKVAVAWFSSDEKYNDNCEQSSTARAQLFKSIIAVNRGVKINLDRIAFRFVLDLDLIQAWLNIYNALWTADLHYCCSSPQLCSVHQMRIVNKLLA